MSIGSSRLVFIAISVLFVITMGCSQRSRSSYTPDTQQPDGDVAQQDGTTETLEQEVAEDNVVDPDAPQGETSSADTKDDGLCTPSCDGKECGDDGCGGLCGKCPEVAPFCNELGKCEIQCVPDCEGKECGSDGCDGECGVCPEIAPVCGENQKCTLACEPQCDGKECGPDGCGAQCGSCDDEDTFCDDNGLCKPVCHPDCTDKVCGDDGCGGDCGQCQGSDFCDDGVCLDQLCQGVECGEHGVCGVEPGFAICNCDVGHIFLGSGCVATTADYVIQGVVEFGTPTPPTGVFQHLTGKKSHFTLTLEPTGFTNTTCGLDPWQQSNCVEIEGKIVEAFVDSADSTVNAGLQGLANKSIEMVLTVSGSLVSIELGNMVTNNYPSGISWAMEFHKTTTEDIAIVSDYPVLSDFYVEKSTFILRRYSDWDMAGYLSGQASYELDVVNDAP